MIIIKRNQSIYELAKKYPDIKKIMAEIGFKDIVKPGMLQTVGKVMTIDKGARMKNIQMEKIIKAFETEGFQLI